MTRPRSDVERSLRVVVRQVYVSPAGKAQARRVDVARAARDVYDGLSFIVRAVHVVAEVF